MKVPGAQGLHSTCDDAGWCQPGGQSSQVTLPLAGENFPALQAVQEVVAAVAAKKPAGQGLHAAAADAEKVPGWQASQRDTPPREKVPALQVLQSVAPVVLSVANPAGQDRQSLSWALGAYFPKTQVLHS